MCSQLDLSNLTALFRSVVDIESVSRNEKAIADEVEMVVRDCEHLEVTRRGNTIVARTDSRRSERVVIAGHLDTVPVADNLPSTITSGTDGEIVYGRGTADMKGGITCMLWLARLLNSPARDITWIFYECEEIEASANGLAKLIASDPHLVDDASLAILMEPTSALVEGGCQGTMRFELTVSGVAAHSARSWLGDNAIHGLEPILSIIRRFDARQIDVDGLTYREGLNATMVRGGIAGNVIPDEAVVQINYRFAPDKTADQALVRMQALFSGWPMKIVDLSESARPGLDRPIAQDFLAATGGQARAKYGWTDVARFAAVGIPALNYGPADAGKAHAADECCPMNDIYRCVEGLQTWLS